MLIYRSFLIIALLFLAHCTPRNGHTTSALRLRHHCSPPQSDMGTLRNVQKNMPLPHARSSSATSSFFDSLKKKREDFQHFISARPAKTGLIKINLQSITLVELLRS